MTIQPSTGPSETCFEVSIIDDGDVESNEEFGITFRIPPGANAQPGITSSTSVTIIDNDQGRHNIPTCVVLPISTTHTCIHIYMHW